MNKNVCPICKMVIPNVCPKCWKLLNNDNLICGTMTHHCFNCWRQNK